MGAPVAEIMRPTQMGTRSGRTAGTRVEAPGLVVQVGRPPGPHEVIEAVVGDRAGGGGCRGVPPGPLLWVATTVPGRLMAGQRLLVSLMEVRFLPREPLMP